VSQVLRDALALWVRKDPKEILERQETRVPSVLQALLVSVV